MFCLWYELYIEGKSINELEIYNEQGNDYKLA